MRHLAIMVNLEYDPTAAFRDQVVHFQFRSWDASALASLKIAAVGAG
ncbi:hypothetical protein ACNKHW_24360 [Shigella flexneri]